jgi:hypothetical protein
MSEFRYLPISRLDESLLLPLMHEEEKAWMSDLNWDYSPIRQILISFARQKLLPGYVAVDNNNAIAYTYFLVNQAKGVIGALFVAKTDQSQKAVEELISLAISSLKDSPTIRRIEAQIMPFNDANLTATFVQHGFSCFPRYFLALDLQNHRKAAGDSSTLHIIPWSSACLERAAELSLRAYRDQPDARSVRITVPRPAAKTIFAVSSKIPAVEFLSRIHLSWPSTNADILAGFSFVRKFRMGLR